MSAPGIGTHSRRNAREWERIDDGRARERERERERERGGGGRERDRVKGNRGERESRRERERKKERKIRREEATGTAVDRVPLCSATFDDNTRSLLPVPSTAHRVLINFRTHARSSASPSVIPLTDPCSLHRLKNAVSLCSRDSFDLDAARIRESIGRCTLVDTLARACLAYTYIIYT